MKSQVLHTVWCHISCEAAGEFWHWSLSGVKGLIEWWSEMPSHDMHCIFQNYFVITLQSVSKLMRHLTIFWQNFEYPNGKTSPLPPAQCWPDMKWPVPEGVINIDPQHIFFALVRSSWERFQNFAQCLTHFATNWSFYSSFTWPLQNADCFAIFSYLWFDSLLFSRKGRSWKTPSAHHQLQTAANCHWRTPRWQCCKSAEKHIIFEACAYCQISVYITPSCTKKPLKRWVQHSKTQELVSRCLKLGTWDKWSQKTCE